MAVSTRPKSVMQILHTSLWAGQAGSAGGRGGPLQSRGRSRAKQELSDLDRVERGPLAQVVSDDPERDPARQRDVLADSPDVDRVAASRVHRLRVLAVERVVHHLDARRVRQNLTR